MDKWKHSLALLTLLSLGSKAHKESGSPGAKSFKASYELCFPPRTFLLGKDVEAEPPAHFPSHLCCTSGSAGNISAGLITGITWRKRSRVWLGLCS